ncbi:MAG TPA: uS14 family ribosomal protein [Candidatus Woesebacteria bacterium]|nr:uS14 family ribosomal protein [Candidatus Woesebacteria bacterium]HNS94682.1 uS14 family ribosomal protein [Candidatus Woesebacteria bacterium]
MASKSTVVRLSGKLKYAVRKRNFCAFTGRTRGYMRRFGMSRIVFREKALKGELPGVKKLSW